MPALPSSAFQPPSVLIVDDEPALRFALRRYFTRRGWAVHEAASGEAALALLLAPGRAYEAVVCDVQMPGISGLDVCRQLAVAAPWWLDRLVLATGDAASVVVGQCPVIEKPFAAEALFALTCELAGRALA